MLSNEHIEGEDLGQEKSFWFWNLAILRTILSEGEFIWHPLSFTNYTLPQFLQLSTNQTVRAQQEAEREESEFPPTTAVIKTPQ
jgi:hypothetical protein